MSADRPTTPALVELRAAAEHARWRVARYRRRLYLGYGESQRLDELERIAHGAADRLHRAQARDHADHTQPLDRPDDAQARDHAEDAQALDRPDDAQAAG